LIQEKNMMKILLIRCVSIQNPCKVSGRSIWGQLNDNILTDPTYCVYESQLATGLEPIGVARCHLMTSVRVFGHDLSTPRVVSLQIFAHLTPANRIWRAALGIIGH
jgi:hypothetical protein